MFTAILLPIVAIVVLSRSFSSKQSSKIFLDHGDKLVLTLTHSLYNRSVDGLCGDPSDDGALSKKSRCQRSGGLRLESTVGVAEICHARDHRQDCDRAKQHLERSIFWLGFLGDSGTVLSNPVFFGQTLV
jgi:hypothetical protein